MLHTTEDLRIQWTKVVLPPVFLEEERPISEAASAAIFDTRNEISAILNGRDTRLLALVGPCSIHDPKAAREYASLLKSAITEFSADLRIVMRVYFEKPRTIVGWKGLINDPYLDHSYKINDGLRLARNLRLGLAEMGDVSFRLGHLEQDSFESMMTSEDFLGTLADTMLEGVPQCSDCAFLPYCGADPVFHHVTQGDRVGHKAWSDFCAKQTGVLRHVLTLLEDDSEAREVLLKWI